MTDEAIAALKEDLKKSSGAKFEEGTVIRWTSRNETRDIDYTYVAVKAAGKWWISGTGVWYGKNVFSNSEFVDDVLSADEVTKVEVATDFVTVV